MGHLGRLLAGVAGVAGAFVGTATADALVPDDFGGDVEL